MRRALRLAAAVATCACSSSSHPPDCAIAGMYESSGTAETGDCPGTTSPVADTFTVSGGMATLVFAGLTGAGIQGPVSGCTWTASATLTETDAVDPAPGSDELQVQYSYTFTGTGFTGTLTEMADATTSLPNGCSGTIAVTGTRQ